MYKILNGQVAVPAISVDLTLSSRPSRSADANQQKLVTVRSYTENYRQSYSIRTVKDWNALPQSVVSAGSLALFKSRLPVSSHHRHAPPRCDTSVLGPCRLTIQIQIQRLPTIAWLNVTISRQRRHVYSSEKAEETRTSIFRHCSASVELFTHRDPLYFKH